MPNERFMSSFINEAQKSTNEILPDPYGDDEDVVGDSSWTSSLDKNKLNIDDTEEMSDVVNSFMSEESDESDESDEDDSYVLPSIPREEHKVEEVKQKPVQKVEEVKVVTKPEVPVERKVEKVQPKQEPVYEDKDENEEEEQEQTRRRRGRPTVEETKAIIEENKEKERLRELDEYSKTIISYVASKVLEGVLNDFESSIYNETYKKKLLNEYIDTGVKNPLFVALINECIESKYEDSYMEEKTTLVLSYIVNTEEEE